MVAQERFLAFSLEIPVNFFAAVGYSQPEKTVHHWLRYGLDFFV
jgi:hypothetical protein